MPTVTDTSTGYKAEVEPPTGKTAKELVDALPGGAAGVLKDGLNAADATIKVTEVGICVEPSDGSACPAGGGGDDPCFSREAEACRIVDTSVAPFAAFRACFDETAPSVAERVKMTALTGGDYILSAGKDQAYKFTRVIVNQHREANFKSALLEINHANGELSLTPDHVLEVDGEFVPARLAAAGSKLGESEVSVVTATAGEVIRIPMPVLTEETRKGYIKQARGEAESARVSVRNARRDGLGMLKELLKEKEISEDEERRGQDVIQKLTDDFVAKVESALSEKETDLMAI